LNSNGSVKSYQKISDTAGGFTGIPYDYYSFGRSVSGIGDLDGDGITDIVVGAPADGDGGLGKGAVWVLFLNNGQPRLPIYTEFYGKGETTNFSEVLDLANVIAPVLATSDAKIEWAGSGYNANGKNFDNAITINHNFVSVDVSKLDNTFNRSANITFKTVTYPSLFAYEILRNGQPCPAPECVKISANPVKFKVSHFSNYTTNGTGVVPEFNNGLVLMLSVFVVLFAVIYRVKN